MLDVNYKIALSEVDEILKYTDEELVNKIPQYIKNFIYDNKDMEYKANIDSNIPIEEQEIKKETEAILSLIYRSYWCSEEEKQEFIEKDKREFEEIENEKREKYNVDNIFNNNTNEKYEKVPEEKALIEVKKDNLFTIIINKIKRIFKIK